MSTSAPAGTSSGGEENFSEFYTEVKQIEKRDSVLTSHQQIDRLLRRGSTYFNLNPFEVLQLEPETPIEQIKKKYRSLSFLVHPDKNQNDKDRAEQAFEIVNKAWKILENELTRKKCLDVYEEAKDRTDHMIAEKKKKLKKDGKDNRIPEDDPIKYKHAIYVMVMKLFADMERRRQQLDSKDQEERKRKREAEIEEEERKKSEKEWQKNFEESRQSRVDSWHNFQAGKTKKAKKQKVAPSAFNPPKLKPESR